MKCQPRDWHTVHPIMDLMGRYDREKAKRIIDLVDGVVLQRGQRIVGEGAMK